MHLIPAVPTRNTALIESLRSNGVKLTNFNGRPFLESIEMDSSAHPDVREPNLGDWTQAWRVASIAGLIGLFISVVTLWFGHGDSLVYVALGVQDQEVTPYIIETLHRTDLLDDKPNVLRPNLGHDGKYFLLQAWDPFYISTQHATHLDRPAYRAQRMLFPLVAGLGGLAPKNTVPWLMTVTNVLALVMGTLGAARLVEQMGGHAGYGLAFMINPGVLAEVNIGGAGVMAFATAVWGTLAIEQGNTRRASIWFLLSVLSRESMLLFLAGVVALRWMRTGKIPFSLAVPAAMGVAVWGTYVRYRLGTGAAVKEVREIGLPLQGMIEGVPHWVDGSPVNWILIIVILGTILWFTVRLFREPSTYLSWGAGGFVLLASVLSAVVWQDPNDTARAILPIFTALAISVGLSRDQSRRAKTSIPAVAS